MNQQTFTYKLRGDCYTDYIECKNHLDDCDVVITDDVYEPQFLTIGNHNIPIPDFDWTFTTTATKEELIYMMKHKRHVDWHIMWETINYANDYTGDRINE
jgi:hypothetical protein